MPRSLANLFFIWFLALLGCEDKLVTTSDGRTSGSLGFFVALKQLKAVKKEESEDEGYSCKTALQSSLCLSNTFKSNPAQFVIVQLNFFSF